MAETQLHEAFINGRHKVLGKELRPYCLWHKLLLEAIPHPLIKRQPVGIAELASAVGICRLRYGQTGGMTPRIGLIQGWKLGRGGLLLEMDAFWRYMDDFVQKPEYSIRAPKSSKGSSSISITPAPETFRIAADIIGWSHWPEAYVWELPIGIALWYQSIAIREQGRPSGVHVDYMSDWDRERQAEFKAEQAAAAAAKSKE